MIDGANACPPEACGGTLEYLELCDGMCGWYRGIWDPTIFDMSAISFTPKRGQVKRKG
jgi:hypothetical protein